MSPYFSSTIDRVRAAFPGRPDIAETFAGALSNTIETTVRTVPNGGTFVATGDIPAMWLRDSTAQVETYLRWSRNDHELRELLAGVVRRQAAMIAVDPYANSFNEYPDGSHFGSDTPEPGPWAWERKYELDSLCYPVRLVHRLRAASGSDAHLDASVHAMFATIVDTMVTEQQHDDSPYRFRRRGRNLLRAESLPRGGRGTPVGPTGMVWSGFRPSDDACSYGYLVPANMMAAVSLDQIAELAASHFADAGLADRAARLAAQIRVGIERYAVVEHPDHGRIWAYEVDGLGNQLLMDDANIPSLLSAPYLGFCALDDPTYLRTRAFALSPANPYFFSGTYAEGIGSPHTHSRWVWPLALAMRGLTSTDRAEQLALLDTLVATTAGTELMHESFDVDNPSRFSRPWFGWANSLFAEFVLRLLD